MNSIDAEIIISEFTMGLEAAGQNELRNLRLHEEDRHIVITAAGTGGRNRHRRETLESLKPNARTIGQITAREIQGDWTGPNGLPTRTIRDTAHEFLTGMEQGGVTEAGSIQIEQVVEGMVITVQYPGDREHRHPATEEHGHARQLGTNVALTMIQEAGEAARGNRRKSPAQSPQDAGETNVGPMKIYVAGPYTGSTRAEVEANVARAIDAGIELFRRGHQPYVPHLTDLVDQRARETGREMSWEDFMAWDAPWLQASDALLLLAESRGALIELREALMELREAERLGKTIFRSLDEVREARTEPGPA